MQAFISFNSQQVIGMLKRHLQQIGAPDCTEIEMEVDFTQLGDIKDFRLKFKIPHPHETTESQRTDAGQIAICSQQFIKCNTTKPGRGSH
jgi:hypothetical protein